MAKGSILLVTYNGGKNMLAIQEIHISWFKSDRSPEGANERKKYIHPKELNPPLKTEESTYFINVHDFLQLGKVYSTFEAFDKFYANQQSDHTESAESKRIRLLERNKSIARMNGQFTDSIHIPGIIIQKEDNTFRIKWHSLEKQYEYHPIRNGHNEDYNNPASGFFGKNILCETAFILKDGESGMIDYNYRCTYEEQHYERFVLYFVNTSSLSTTTFTEADYKYKYDQTAILF